MWWSKATGALEGAAGLDPAARALARVVDKTLPRGPVKDALHGRWLGHPTHPLLVTLPIGLWSGASLLDLLGGAGDRDAARRLVGAGVLSVSAAAAAGLADWSELGQDDKPKRVGVVHAAVNVASTLLYSASWLARRRGDHRRGQRLALAGAAAVSVGGYLGGHLSYSEAVGVNRNYGTDKAPTEWTDAGAAADLREDGVLGVQVADQPVVLARSGGELYAMNAVCSHYEGPLDQGEIRDGCVVCPWHGSAFRLRDGSVARGPATAPQLAYEVRTMGERLQVRARQ